MDYSWEGIQGYTTLLPTLPPDIIEGQLNNGVFKIITQPNSTVADLKTAIGRHFNMDVSNFYVTADGSSLMNSAGRQRNILIQLNDGYPVKAKSTHFNSYTVTTAGGGAYAQVERDIQAHEVNFNGSFRDSYNDNFND